jgi:LEA14-like dessication related protein
MRWRLLVLLLALGVTACLPRVEQPEIWLGGVRLASIGLTGGVVDIELSVHNPNSFALRASGLTYDVELEDPGGGGWLEFAAGDAPAVEVGARDTAMVVVPVEFEYRRLGRAIRALIQSGSFQYRVHGVVALEGPLRREIPYRQTGTVTPSGVR